MSIKSIAKAAGVSPSTVSRVLNNPGYKCSVPGLRDKIWKIAMEQNYVPNEAARNLKRGISERENKTYYINVLVTRMDASHTDPFFAELLRVVESEIHENGCILSKVWYNSLFSNDRKCRNENLDRIVNDMYEDANGKNDGMIVIGRCNKLALKKLKSRYKSIVTLNRNSTNYEVDEVLCDGRKIASMAVEYLISLGHRNIGYVGGCHNEERYNGYIDTMKKYDLDIIPEYVIETNQTEAEGYEVMKNFLQSDDCPTGIYCANDISAIGMLKCLNRYRKRYYMPSIISSDDIDEAQYTKPMLTTVRLPKEEMGQYGFNTTLLHGIDHTDPFGATHVPIYQSSAFRHESAEELEQIFANKAMGFSYTRINNPTIEAFEKRIAKLEGGVGSIACASGMAALTNAILNILQSGDEIVAGCGLYGGTVELFDELESFGITTRYVKENVPHEYETLINDRTRLVFAETIGNPKLDVTDIAAVAQVAHAHGLPFMVDNTTATPYLIQPLKLGADIVVHSSSKYINGSSNAISGVLVYGGKFKWDAKRYPGMKPFLKFGPFAYLAKLRNGLFRSMGACLSPQNAFLNNLGLETLGLRVERQCSNAWKLAEYIKSLDTGIVVNYPGCLDSPYHELAKKQLHGGYGAILTLRAGSKERAFGIINALKLPLIVSNIGDTKTLVIHPASTIAAHLSKEAQRESGVYEDQIRISVGIEDIEDLKQDFKNAIEKEV